MSILKYKQTISDMSISELIREKDSVNNLVSISDEMSLKIHLILSELESRNK